jgi:tetratricopeptide (TPR) repeat protein
MIHWSIDMRSILSAMLSIVLLEVGCLYPANASEAVWEELMKAARASQNAGDLARAEKLLQSALKDAAADPDGPREAQTLLWLGKIYTAQKNYLRARDTLDKAFVKSRGFEFIMDPAIVEGIKEELVKVRRRQYGKSDPISNFNESGVIKFDAEKELETGTQAFRAGNFSKASPLLENVFYTYTTEASLETENAQRCLSMLFQCYRNMQSFERAEKILKGTIDKMMIQRGGNIDFSRPAAISFLYLSALFHAQGKEAEAEAMADRGFNIYSSPGMSNINFSLAKLIEEWKLDGKEAEATFIEGLYNKRRAELRNSKKSRRAMDLEWEEDTVSPKK